MASSITAMAPTTVATGFVDHMAAMDTPKRMKGHSDRPRVASTTSAALTGISLTSSQTLPSLSATVTTSGGHDWVGDRFSKGTWLSVPPTWFSDGTFDALAVPEGRLAFAGSDIAPEGAGWIEGAVGSGVDAAVYVQTLFKNG